MTWKSYIPFSGDKTVRNKLSELEKEEGSLVVVFGVTAGKIVENLVLFDLSRAIRFTAATALIGAFYVYRHEVQTVKEQAQEKVEDAKEKAEDAVDGDSE